MESHEFKLAKSEIDNVKQEIVHVKELIHHVKELMVQHDKLTELAITKTEASINERFAKANEFREQQKDIIVTFARQKETDQAMDALEARLDQNLRAVSEKFTAQDRQMQVLIDANAEISNRGIGSLNTWRENQQGSIKVIMAVGGFIIAIVLALLIGFLQRIL